MTDVDIFRKVKADQKLMGLEESVSKIRPSRKGNLMLELEKPLGKTAKNFIDKLEELLGKKYKYGPKSKILSCNA